MAGNRITWLPNSGADTASYNLERATGLAGPWAVIVNIPQDQNVLHYDVATGTLFYQDETGTPTSFYRLIAVGTDATLSPPSPPFQANTTGSTTPIAQVKLDHNYGIRGALSYQTVGGLPVENAVIRIYRKPDFDAGLEPIQMTKMTALGTWENPAYVDAGFTYVVHFLKEGLYGPDHVTITV
jgi:hypothetical protein